MVYDLLEYLQVPVSWIPAQLLDRSQITGPHNWDRDIHMSPGGTSQVLGEIWVLGEGAMST